VSQNLQFGSPKIKPPAYVDLMVSGTGIPWEDRGSVGFMGAFFGTAFSMMFHPINTLAKMRRPETAKDAHVFTYVMGVVWFFAVAIQSAFAYFVFYAKDATLDIDGQQYVINTILEGVLAAGASALLPRVVAWMFYRLTAFDMTAKAPPVLVYNCIVYMTSPSLLALIPGGPRPWLAIGPCLAGVWMLFLILIVAIRRLRIGIGATVIGGILTFLACTGMVVGGIVLIQAIWSNVLGKSSLNPVVPTENGTAHVQ
jgi:hypothetical protein